MSTSAVRLEADVVRFDGDNEADAGARPCQPAGIGAVDGGEEQPAGT
jgi:hypothetical protein